MTRFASTLIRVNDDRRVQKIREDEAAQVARDFAPIIARAKANSERLMAQTGWMAIA